MSQWEMVEIGKYCTSVSNVRADYFSNIDKFMYIDIAAVNRETKTISSIEPTSAKDAPSRAKQIIKENDVLVSTVRPNLNAVAKANSLVDGAIASTAFCILRSNADKIDPTYLYYFVRSNRFINHLNGLATGASYPAVSDKIVKGCKIPLPPLDIQKQIVARLELAQVLIYQRKQQVDLMDVLIQSTFFEIFGDPVTNEKGWEIKKFGSIGNLDRGVSKHRPRNAPGLLGGKYPLIQTGDVANSGGYITSYKSTYSELGLKQSKLWPAGTLCITIAANIADTGILKFDSCFPDSVVGFTCDSHSTIEYVRLWLNCIKSNIESVAPAVAQKNINLAILRDLDIPFPPIDLQVTFAEQVERIEALKQQMTASLTELEQNFNALMQQSFGG